MERMCMCWLFAKRARRWIRCLSSVSEFCRRVRYSADAERTQIRSPAEIARQKRPSFAFWATSAHPPGTGRSILCRTCEGYSQGGTYGDEGVLQSCGSSLPRARALFISGVDRSVGRRPVFADANAQHQSCRPLWVKSSGSCRSTCCVLRDENTGALTGGGLCQAWLHHGRMGRKQC